MLVINFSIQNNRFIPRSICLGMFESVPIPINRTSQVPHQGQSSEPCQCWVLYHATTRSVTFTVSGTFRPRQGTPYLLVPPPPPPMEAVWPVSQGTGL